MRLKERLFPRLHQRPKIDAVPAFPEGTKIPKVIHQTFHSKRLPPIIEENVARIKALNPGWKYVLHDDGDVSDFICTYYGPKILSYYTRINAGYGAARADLFRYLLLYKLGGVYLDVKSSPERPLDEILRSDDRYLLSGWKNKDNEPFKGWGIYPELNRIEGGEFQQWHIVAAPGHPFLKTVLENVLCNIDSYNPFLHGTGRLGVLRVTGPIAYTLAIASVRHLHDHRFVDSQDDLGFRYSIFGKNYAQARNIFNQPHYSELRTSLVDLDLKRRLWALLIAAKGQ